MKQTRILFASSVALMIGLTAGCASNPELEQPVGEVAQAEVDAPKPVQTESATELVEDSSVQETAVESEEANADDASSSVSETTEQVQVAGESPRDVEEQTGSTSSAGVPDTDTLVQEDGPSELATPASQGAATEDAVSADVSVTQEVVATSSAELAASESTPEPVIEQKPTQASVQSAININRGDLPYRLDLWILEKDILAGDALVLSTPTMQMGEGDFLSQIRLLLNEEQLKVVSSSDIDAGLSGVGVRLNGGELVSFDRLDGTSIGVLEGDWLNQLSQGGALEIRLGFFPDKDKDSPVFSKEASLDALSKLVPTYLKLK